MADDSSTQSQSPPSRTRRSSFAGETFANLFGGGHRGSMSRTSSENNANANNGQQPTSSYAGPITSAAAQAQRRRLSLTTLGLSGSPNQTSPFNSYTGRRDSYGSGNDSIDESAIEDEPSNAPLPQTPFARRMSFGAKAMRDVRTGGGNTPPGQNGGHTSASSSGTNTATSQPLQKAQNGTISSRDVKGRGSSEGFNWSDNFRTRAERTSVAGAPGMPGGLGNGSPRQNHGRAQSVAIMEPPQPPREMPKPKEQVRPDHFQERILKGDFYMD